MCGAASSKTNKKIMIMKKELFYPESPDDHDEALQLSLLELDLLSSERSGRHIAADTLCRVMNTYF